LPERRVLIVRLLCHKVYPVGPVYLLSALRRSLPGADLRLLDLALEDTRRAGRILEEAVRGYAPDVVALSWRDIQIFSPQEADGALRDAFTFFHDPSLTRKVAAAARGVRDMLVYRSALARNLWLVRLVARAFPEIRIALGGPAVAIFGDRLKGRLPAPVRTFPETGLDAFFRWLGLPPPPDPLEPAIDFERLEESFPQWSEYRTETIGVQTKRGCPHECLYCLYGRLEGKHVRRRDPLRVVDEIRGYAERWGARRFWFADAQLLSVPGDDAHLAAILEGMLETRLPLQWSGYLRVHELEPPLARLMVRSGLSDLEVSLGSGSQRIVDGLKLGFRVRDVLRGIDVLRTAGYAGRVLLNLSLNAPGETGETLRETFDVVRELRAMLGKDRVVPVIFFLAIQPGTGIELLARETGHLGPHYDPLSVLPWQVLRLIYNPPPLGRMIGRACARAFALSPSAPGELVLKDLESRLAGQRRPGPEEE
jgi:hypothetical protein